MSRFLKLSNFVVNTSKIMYVEIKSAEYILTVSNPNLSGTFLMGSGNFYSDMTTFFVSEKHNPQDFQKVKKWIEEME